MASYVYPPVVSPGQSPPLAVVTPYDHRAWIYIATSLGVSMTLMSSAIRVFMRWSSRVGWGPDDITIAISTVISFFQSAVVLAAGSYGLGSSTFITSSSSLDTAQKLYYASNLLYVLVLGLSRQSVMYFLRRITPVDLHRRVLAVLLVVEVSWTLIFFLATAVQCVSSHPWMLVGTCKDGWIARWQAAEITGAILEIAIFIMAVWALVWNLQVANKKRATITIAFALRMIIIIVFVGVRLSSFDDQGFLSDPTLHESTFICWTQAEMNLSVMGATIPIAHRFLASLVSYYGGAGGHHANSIQQTTFGSRSDKTNTFKLGSLQSGKSGMTDRSRSTRREDFPQEPYSGEVRNSVRYSVGIQSSDVAVEPTPRLTIDSQSVMIRKDTTYEIAYDT